MLRGILKVMDLSSCPSRAQKLRFANIRTQNFFFFKTVSQVDFFVNNVSLDFLTSVRPICKRQPLQEPKLQAEKIKKIKNTNKLNLLWLQVESESKGSSRRMVQT